MRVASVQPNDHAGSRGHVRGGAETRAESTPDAGRASAFPAIPASLLARYTASVPRYTSYPTVPDWTGAFDADTWRAHLATLGTTRDPLSLYVHLPFCASRCLYCGCNATVTKHESVVDTYLDRLEHEVRMVSDSIITPPPVVELHLGGGTPNFLNERQTDRLLRVLKRAFRFDARTELSVEADPRLVTTGQLAHYRALGFNRISFGVQDLDADVQVAIGRIQPELLVRDVVARAREAGFSGINLDLIYGLPLQTPSSFAHTVASVIEMNPHRIACFGYAHVPWMHAHQKRIDITTLPMSAERIALFRYAAQALTEAGYVWIGLDHFARPEDPLAVAAMAGKLHRNFMGYTTRRTNNLLGIGCSAISEVNGWFAQNNSGLGAWQRDIDAGRLSLSRGHVHTADDVERGAAISHLMCNAELPFDQFVGDTESMVDSFQAFERDGLVAFEQERVVVTPLGRFFLRNMCTTLDAYRVEATKGDQRFSRSV